MKSNILNRLVSGKKTGAAVAGALRQGMAALGLVCCLGMAMGTAVQAEEGTAQNTSTAAADQTQQQEVAAGQLQQGLAEAQLQQVAEPQEQVTAATYVIRVNVAANAVTVYKNGIPVRTMVCSTGVSTPHSGSYHISDKYVWRPLFQNVYGQYTCRIVGSILFHSVPYSVNGDKASLTTDHYDKLGQADSLGCVRLMVADAKWIYDNCPSGTEVVFYDDVQVAGPLGKAFFSPIGGYDASLSCWDPSDPDPANPWNAYLGYAFDAAEYMECNPDLPMAYEWNEDSLRFHWLSVGLLEGRRSRKDFSVLEYKALHPEMSIVLGDDNLAWVKAYNDNRRMLESTGFDAIAYANKYPDVLQAYGYNTDLLRQHYLLVGMAEGRSDH